jgi:hypothetical protein
MDEFTGHRKAVVARLEDAAKAVSKTVTVLAGPTAAEQPRLLRVSPADRENRDG